MHNISSCPAGQPPPPCLWATGAADGRCPVVPSPPNYRSAAPTGTPRVKAYPVYLVSDLFRVPVCPLLEATGSPSRPPGAPWGATMGTQNSSKTRYTGYTLFSICFGFLFAPSQVPLTVQMYLQNALGCQNGNSKQFQNKVYQVYLNSGTHVY